MVIYDQRFEFPIHTKEIVHANILEVKAGTTGYCDGDTGHSGKTYFSIRDLGGTDITVNLIDGGFEVVLGGDAELATIIKALKYIKKKLEVDSNEAV